MAGRVIHIGVLTPHAAAGPEAEFAAMAPGRLVTAVVRVSTETAAASVTSGPPTPVVARVLTAPPVLDDAAGRLAAGSIDVIGYASTSSAYAIGFDDEVAMVSRLSRRTGIPVAATCASAVGAVRALEVERIALVSPPWFDDEVNRLGAAYFRSQGVHVVSSASADLPRDPRRIQTAAVIEWTSRHAPDEAEAVWIGGNGFRAAGAIEALEDTIGRPVLTANQVLLWALLAHAGATFEVSGYGQLFTRKPRPAI
jgi:maleate isomerase